MSTVKKIISKLIKKNISISVGESCTGGLIAYSLAKESGVSKIFSGGIICYSNKSKIKYLLVSKKTLSNHGAVSSNVANYISSGVTKIVANQYSLAALKSDGSVITWGGTKDSFSKDIAIS